MRATTIASLVACAFAGQFVAQAETIPADPSIVRSSAIGRTHDCSKYYPLSSQRDGETGEVTIGYDVDASGAISNVHLLRSSGANRLDSAALACASEAWRNTPMTKNGVPMPSPGHEATIRFSLGNLVPGELFFWSGLKLDRAGDHSAAIAKFDRAIAANPNFIEAYLARGIAHDAMNEAELALADYRAAARISDQSHHLDR